MIKWVVLLIKSMTGYGRKEDIVDGKKITCEIKSVNHRYSDYSIKVPRYYGFMDEGPAHLSIQTYTDDIHP